MCRESFQATDKQEMMKRVSRQFKLIMQPYYRSGKITKDEYKDIMRKAVPAVRYFSLTCTGWAKKPDCFLKVCNSHIR